MSLDLHLTEIGLKSFLRQRVQLNTPWDCIKTEPHLSYWNSLATATQELLQQDDRCNIETWFKQYKVDLRSFEVSGGQQKNSEVTVYTDGCKTEHGVGSGYAVNFRNQRIQSHSSKLSNAATVF